MRNLGHIQFHALHIWRLYGNGCSFSWSVCFAAVEGVLIIEGRNVTVESMGIAV
jgi:hypothetical protein